MSDGMNHEFEINFTFLFVKVSVLSSTVEAAGSSMRVPIAARGSIQIKLKFFVYFIIAFNF